METIPKIPGYIIEKEIGSGATSTIYMGIQEKLNRKVAIKILNPETLKNADDSKRFFREPEIASKLNHHNIVTIFDVGHVGSYHYIIMECLGESLKKKIRRLEKLQVYDAFQILRQLSEALAYAHLNGVLHRDLKPTNILFRNEKLPVIVDFGLALSGDITEKLTMQGMIMGTFCYMSPEQCRGEKSEQASDIYSLGVVLYEMLTGKVPYVSENPFNILHKHQFDPIPQLPPKLNNFQPLIDHMMAKEKDKRFKSGKEVIEMIDALNMNTIKIDNDRTVLYTPPEGDNKTIILKQEIKKKKWQRRWKKNKLLILLILSLIAFLTVIIVIITRLR